MVRVCQQVARSIYCQTTSPFSNYKIISEVRCDRLSHDFDKTILSKVSKVSDESTQKQVYCLAKDLMVQHSIDLRARTSASLFATETIARYAINDLARTQSELGRMAV